DSEVVWQVVAGHTILPSAAAPLQPLRNFFADHLGPPFLPRLVEELVGALDLHVVQRQVFTQQPRVQVLDVLLDRGDRAWCSVTRVGLGDVVDGYVGKQQAIRGVAR